MVQNDVVALSLFVVKIPLMEIQNGTLIYSTNVFISRRLPVMKSAKPDSTEILPCMGSWCAFNLMSRVKRSPSAVEQKFGKGCVACVLLVIWPRFKLTRSVRK
ncbi:hypothetical protein AVEN_106815-1 [Araneus ventricosus]|uniref:Uncharacterized protein n=1 Tax=Araneus ventricosus TaxID=182803 RepID=A0A4Y2WW98_ARAVE|nr:hypothetical protein AVEN_106815-1 [Araneus ventricosus]